MELRLCCLSLSSVRPWAQAHVPEVQICRGIISWCFFCAQLGSAGLASAWLGLAWLDDSYCGVSRLAFFLIRKKKANKFGMEVWRIFVAFSLLLLSFLRCLSTDVTNARQCSTGAFMGLPPTTISSFIYWDCYRNWFVAIFVAYMRFFLPFVLRNFVHFAFRISFAKNAFAVCPRRVYLMLFKRCF